MSTARGFSGLDLSAARVSWGVRCRLTRLVGRKVSVVGRQVSTKRGLMGREVSTFWVLWGFLSGERFGGAASVGKAAGRGGHAA